MMYNRNLRKQLKIMFVCHGNICRSPMAEFVMKDKIKERGLENRVKVFSSATSYEETGNPVYPPAVAKMREEGVTIYPHKAVTIEKDDYDSYDMFVGMEQRNVSISFPLPRRWLLPWGLRWWRPPALRRTTSSAR